MSSHRGVCLACAACINGEIAIRTRAGKRPIRVATVVCARKLGGALVHIFTDAAIILRLKARVTAALVAYWAVLTKLRTGVGRQLAFVDIALIFIREVTTVILPIAKKTVIDAVLVCTQEVTVRTRGTLGSLFVTQVWFLVRPVPAIIPAVTDGIVGNAAVIVACELVLPTTVLLASVWFVRAILTVMISIAVEAVQDANLVEALELISLTLAKGAVKTWVLIRVVQAVASAVTLPGVGDALACAIALELTLTALAHTTCWWLIRAICAVRLAIAAAQKAYAFAVCTLKLVPCTFVFTALLVRAK